MITNMRCDATTTKQLALKEVIFRSVCNWKAAETSISAQFNTPPTFSMSCSGWPQWLLMFVSICVLACARYLSTNPLRYRSHPAHLSTCLLIAAISSAPNKLTPITGAYQRRFSGEHADEVEGEVVRGWETGEVRKWGDGRRGREIPRWVLLSSLRITATCTSASVAEGSVPQVHISASPNEYPTVERKQMWWVWFSQRISNWLGDCWKDSKILILFILLVFWQKP